MKIKPLIKTHWVASQNPLTVSLAGLQRLVFSPSSEILNPLWTADVKEAVTLPSRQTLQTLPPTAEEEALTSSQRYVLTKDPFWILFSNQQQVSYSPKLKALLQSLEFHFEDGSILTLAGIHRKENWPKFLNPQYYFKDSSCNWEKALMSAEELMKPLRITAQQKKQDDFRKSWFAILEILAWAFQRKRQVGDLEVLYRPRLPEWEEAGFALEDLTLLKELPLAATVSSEVAVRESARIRLWQSREHQPEPGILELHAEEALQELEFFFKNSPGDPFQQILPVLPEEEEALQLHSPGSKWASCFVTLESGSSEILKCIQAIENRIGRHHVHFVHRLQVHGDQFQPYLKVRETDGELEMAVAFEMLEQDLTHLNLPRSLVKALNVFQGGLDQIFKLERKDAASRHQQFRANDLLFLRHQGLLVFCLFEMINWILQKPLSSGQEISFFEDLESPEADQSFEKFRAYLQSSIPALLGKPSVAFQELISAKAQAHFDEFLDQLRETLLRDRSLFFLPNQILEISEVREKVLPLLRFLILHWIESSQGKFLLRASSPTGEKFAQALPLFTTPQLLRGPVQDPQEGWTWLEAGRFGQHSIALLFELQDQGVQVELNGTALNNETLPFEFSFQVKDSARAEDSNWFDLHPEIFFNGVRIRSEEVKIHFGQGQSGFIEYQGQIYRIDKKQLPSLKSLQRFWEKIKSIRQGGTRDSFGQKVYQLEKCQALELLMLKAQGFQVTVEGEWKRVFDYYETGLGVEKIELPETTQNELLPHQREGAQWLHDLYQLKLGAILADEMGLGKTFQVLSFFLSLHLKNQLGQCLVVVPTSLVYNWAEEKKKFAKELPLKIFQTAEKEEMAKALEQKEPMVLVTTYGLLLENPDFFHSKDWNVLAFDEAQNLKNITSMRAVSARKLQARFKICITGTPMENNYLEFYSLCDLVVPGSLGNVDNFRRQYVNREIMADSIRELKLISKPLLLRRTKAQVKLSLPSKTVQKVSLPFEAVQKEIYKKMAMTFSRQVEDLIKDQGEKKAQIAMFSALMRLRQICSDPAAVPGVQYAERPTKVEHFLSSLQEHLENQESVVVFTQFLSTLKRLQKELAQLGVPNYVLQGSVTAKDRVRLISEFQTNPQPAVMLMTLKTGGVGLNLTKASVVYHLEPWWNPAVENQATDRAHRMGQKKDVKVYHLLIEGSLEERIADLKIKKQDSFERLFGSDEQIEELEMAGSNALSREDFLYLLK